METPELIKALRCCSGQDCNGCPLRDSDCGGITGVTLRAADALEKLNDFDYSQCAKSLADNARLKAELNCYATPENKPLTLDELRQINDEPVWITSGNIATSAYSGWAIVGRYYDDTVALYTQDNTYYEIAIKRGMIIAYRRPPQAGEKE